VNSLRSSVPLYGLFIVVLLSPVFRFSGPEGMPFPPKGRTSGWLWVVFRLNFVGGSGGRGVIPCDNIIESIFWPPPAVDVTFPLSICQQQQRVTFCTCCGSRDPHPETRIFERIYSIPKAPPHNLFIARRAN